MVNLLEEEAIVPAAAHLKTVPSPLRGADSLFRAHHAEVLRAAFRITGNVADAEDVLQTVFMRVLRRKEALDTSRDVGPYLRRAAVNAALDLLRRRKNTVTAISEDELSGMGGDFSSEMARLPGGRGVVSLSGQVENPAPDDALMARERAATNEKAVSRLREALSGLNPRAAEMFALRYLEGASNEEIALMMDTSATVVAVTLFRTRRRLQKELARDLGGDQ